MERMREHGHAVTLFNRGITASEVPLDVERLRGDRRNKGDLEKALGTHSFDAVIDTTLYTGAEAKDAIEVLKGRTAHYIFISSGQVYLIRKGARRPFHEEDYEGELIPAPPQTDEFDYSNWLYGFDKREAEDQLFRAWAQFRFPVTALRAPMINGERDHYGRILGYVRRLEDGGPILVPHGPALPLRHVYVDDVAMAVRKIVESGAGKGRAFNPSQDETISLEDFLGAVAGMVNRNVRILRLPRAILEQAKLLPSCSPFSGTWMSELDNSRSKSELGVVYTPFAEYLQRVVGYYQRHPELQSEGYKTRSVELQLAGESHPKSHR